MIAHLRFVSLLVLFLSTMVITLTAQEPEETPISQATMLVMEGVELRHKGEPEAAMAKYMQALELEPDNVNALYEVCYTYFQLGEYDKSVEFGERGAAFESPMQGQFYTVIGSCYDIRMEPEKAIKAYRKGIDIAPDAPMIRYNLALTYANTGRLDDAEKTVKDELLINPEHASSHFLLTILYNNRKERIPALLAAARFLTLEPNGPRSPSALRTIESLLTDGIEKGKGKEEGDAAVNITFDMSKSGEGDFTGVELMLTMMTASTIIDSVPKSEYQNIRKVLDLTLGMIGERGSKEKMGSGFAAEYYVPFFAELHKQGYMEALISTIMVSHDDPEAKAWRDDETKKTKVQEFILWSREFEWRRE